MRLHPTIVSLLLIGACGGGWKAEPAGDLRGRVALSWTLDGAFLTAEKCQAEKIEYMDVEIEGASGGGAGYTQVRCDLDRYSLDMTPLGRVILRVAATGKDGRGMPCTRRYGEVSASATTAYPAQPTRVELKAIANACR